MDTLYSNRSVETRPTIVSTLFANLSWKVEPFTCTPSDVWCFLREKDCSIETRTLRCSAILHWHICTNTCFAYVRRIPFFVFFLTRQGQFSYPRVVHSTYHLNSFHHPTKNNTTFSMFLWYFFKIIFLNP